jgi:hypothetical protein
MVINKLTKSRTAQQQRHGREQINKVNKINKVNTFEERSNTTINQTQRNNITINQTQASNGMTPWSTA